MFLSGLRLVRQAADLTVRILLIGIALVLAPFTGIAAFLGGFMNWNFIMAPSASSNALLLFSPIVLYAGVEGGRLVRPGPLAAAAPGHPLEARQALYTCRTEALKTESLSFPGSLSSEYRLEGRLFFTI